MSRPPREVQRSEVRRQELEFYDAVVKRSSSPGRRFAQEAAEGEERYDYYRLMLASPEMSYHLSHMGRLVRSVGLGEGSYSHYDREFADQVLCPLLGTNLVLRTHIPDAVRVGVRIEAIEALQNGRDENLTEDESAAATFVRQIALLEMTDETWERMERRLGERGTIELMIFVGLLGMIIRMQSALGMPAASDEEIPPDDRGPQGGARTAVGSSSTAPAASPERRRAAGAAPAPDQRRRSSMPAIPLQLSRAAPNSAAAAIASPRVANQNSASWAPGSSASPTRR